MNRTPAIVLDVQRQPGANVIGTVDAIKTALPDLEADRCRPTCTSRC
jgi:multidrug efflux pump